MASRLVARRNPEPRLPSKHLTQAGLAWTSGVAIAIASRSEVIRLEIDRLDRHRDRGAGIKVAQFSVGTP